ncbi:hypothetical protein Tco_1377398 [Tanacetum coccineum]
MNHTKLLLNTKQIYEGLVKSYNLDKDLFSSYGKAYSLNRDREGKDKDEDPPAGSNQGLKKWKTSKDTEQEPVFEIANTEMLQEQGGDLGNTEDQPNVEATLMDDWFKKPKRPPTPDPVWNAKKSIDNLTQEILVVPAFNLLNGTCKSLLELEYHFEESYKVVTDQLDWNNPEGHEYPFDLSKPLLLIEAQGCQVGHADYFFNNDIKYLKGRSSSRKYTTSTTKTKATKYDKIKGIEDMVPTLWSPVKVAYDKFAMWGISHWDPKRQKFYSYASNRESKHDVFSRKRIIAVTHVKVMKWYGYGYLEEIIIRREDQTLHNVTPYQWRKHGMRRYRSSHKIQDHTLYSLQEMKLGVHSFYDSQFTYSLIFFFVLMRSRWDKHGSIRALCSETCDLNYSSRLQKIVSPQVSTDDFSENNVYAFMGWGESQCFLISFSRALEKIHEDDLEAMDLKWQLSLLSMRAKRYFQRTGKKIFINANDTTGYDNISKLLIKQTQKLDLSYSGLDEFKEPEFKGYGSENSTEESNIVCEKKSDDSKKNSDDSLVKEQVSNDISSLVESSLNVKETIFPVDKKVESVKPKNQEKPVKKSVRYAEMYRSQTPRGNKRNWNVQKSNQLGSDFVMYNKACFICGSFNHVHAQCKYHQRERMVYGNNYNRVNYNYTAKRTHPNAQRNMVPRAVLMKTGLKTFNTARTVNSAHPKSIVFSAKPMPRFSKTTQSTVRRPFQPKTVLTNKRFTQKVNTAKAQAVNTARPKVVKTARPNSAVVNAVRGKPQQDDTGFIDSGCSRHMTGNIAYLLDFKEFDGGYVTFRGGAYGGRISGKGTLKTDCLDFEDVYFVNELKFNLFSVSQMCDKKNYVLFTDTECLVLSPNFKLPDESQILLKIPRKDNMYSFDMKNIVPK